MRSVVDGTQRLLSRSTMMIKITGGCEAVVKGGAWCIALLCCYAQSEHSTSFTSQCFTSLVKSSDCCPFTVAAAATDSSPGHRGECRLRMCAQSSLANAAQLQPPSPGMLCVTLDRAAFPLATPHPTHQLDHHFSHTARQLYQPYQLYRPSHPRSTSPTHSLSSSARLCLVVGKVGTPGTKQGVSMATAGERLSHSLPAADTRPRPSLRLSSGVSALPAVPAIPTVPPWLNTPTHSLTIFCRLYLVVGMVGIPGTKQGVSMATADE